MGLSGGVVKQRRGSLAQSYPPVSSSSTRMVADRAFDSGSHRDKNDNEIPTPVLEYWHQSQSAGASVPNLAKRASGAVAASMDRRASPRCHVEIRRDE